MKALGAFLQGRCLLGCVKIEGKGQIAQLHDCTAQDHVSLGHPGSVHAGMVVSRSPESLERCRLYENRGSDTLSALTPNHRLFDLSDVTHDGELIFRTFETCQIEARTPSSDFEDNASLEGNVEIP